MKRRAFLKRAAAGVAATSLAKPGACPERGAGALAHDHQLAQEPGHDLRLG